MVSRSALFLAAGQAVNRAADLGLDAAFGRTDTRRGRDVIARLGRIWFVNLPIAALTHGAIHDAGHFARHGEFTDEPGRRVIEQWPWPVPITVSAEYFAPPGSPDTEFDDGLAVLGGGEQASTLTKQRLADQIYRRDTAGYFDWMVLTYASLDYPVYAWTDLSRGIQQRDGDFRQYATEMTYLSPPLQIGSRVTQRLEYHLRTEDRLRHDAWLNLADFSLWQGVARVGRYVATGERRTTNGTLSIGGVRFVPSAYATLSSFGPERGADVRLVSSVLLTHLNVRRITTPMNESLWGTGVALRSRDPHRFLPEGNLDVWQRTGKEPGFRLEAGTTRTLTIAGRPMETSIRLGYKTEGYLLDAPQRATVLAAVTVSGRF